MTDEERWGARGESSTLTEFLQGYPAGKEAQSEVGVGGVRPGDRAQISLWEGRETDSNPAG